MEEDRMANRSGLEVCQHAGFQCNSRAEKSILAIRELQHAAKGMSWRLLFILLLPFPLNSSTGSLRTTATCIGKRSERSSSAHLRLGSHADDARRSQPAHHFADLAHAQTEHAGQLLVLHALLLRRSVGRRSQPSAAAANERQRQGLTCVCSPRAAR